MLGSEHGLTRASDPIASGDGEARAASPDSAVHALLETLEASLPLDAKTPARESDSAPTPVDDNALHRLSEGVNKLAALQMLPSQLLNTGIAQLPLLNKMPGMPAAVIGAAHLGTPHAHDHPPSDGFPLPSMGATIGSGCLSVLIGGIPAARVTDIGIAPTCGGLTPFFNIETGSSNTFIGGMRAARMGVDMTRHCNPMGRAGKSGEEAEGEAEKGEEAASEAGEVSSRARWMGRAGKAWSAGNAAVGPASGATSAADDAWQGEGEAAAMTAAQTAADAAMMLLGNLMGKDPGIEPSMGTLLEGNPTVLIGGFPMPDSQMMWHRAKHGLGKKVRPKLPKRAQELACEFWGEPISAVTGEVKNDFTDYETDDVVPFKWGRHYSSGWRERNGALGYGCRHAWQHELRLLRARAIYTDPRGTEYTFGRRSDGTYGGGCQGYEIEQIDGRRFIVRHEVEGSLEFARAAATDRSACCVRQVRDGALSVLHRNELGRLERIMQTDGRGGTRRAIEFGYDGLGRILQVALTDVDGHVNRIARYAYDANGCLARYRNALDAVSACEYDSQRRIARLTDANGYSFFYRYDAIGRCVESKGRDGLWHVQFQYHPGRTIVTESDGGKWTVLYNEAGTITRVIDPYGGALEYELGVDGRIEREIDSGGRVTRWLYSVSGRNTGRVDRWGNVWPPKDEAPVLRDRPVRAVPSTPLGLLWGEPDRAKISGKILLPPQAEAMAMAMFGSASPTSIGTEPVEHFDAAGRLVSRIDSSGCIERVQRDATGNVVERKDGDGRSYRYEIGSWNLRVAETDPLGNTVRYVHTSKQQIAAIVDANGNESSYTYDHKGRLTCVVRHGVVRETYAYDAANLLTEKRDGDGKLLLRFEARNGLHSKRTLESGEIHLYEYDTRGNAIRASTNDVEVSLAYNAENRRIADMRDGKGTAHIYTAGRLESTTWFGRFTVRYEAVDGQEVWIHTPDGGRHRYRHGVDGNVLLEAANGTTILTCFDGAQRCIGQIEWSRLRNAEPRWTRYTYSTAGELRRVVKSSGDAHAYQYDAARRLTGESRNGWLVRKFEYDRGGNLLSAPLAGWMRYAEGNRLLSSAAGIFSYNSRNHLCTFTRADGCRTEYEYNSKDLLVKVLWSDRTEAWTAGYDGLCRRVYQAYGNDRTDYYWDGDRLAAEQDTDGRLRLYVYANESALVPFLFIDYMCVDADPREGKAYLVCSNQIGLPQRIEDSEGVAAWIAADTDPYGLIRVADGNTVDYNLRFPGHYFDAVTRLHYNRFRSYSPELGRYLQSDPIGQSGGINLYAYVVNPLSVVDVLGLKGNDAASHGNLQPKGDPSEKGDDGEAADAPKNDALSPVDLKSRLQALKDRLKVKIGEEKRTAGVGISDVSSATSDVPGLQNRVFEVGSPIVRRALDMETTPGPIKSPCKPPFARHAEEEFGNQFIKALEEAGYRPDQDGIFHDPTGTARLLMNASKKKGVCDICLLDLRYPRDKKGVVKQLSEKVPNVKFIFETDGSPELTVAVKNGQLV